MHRFVVNIQEVHVQPVTILAPEGTSEADLIAMATNLLEEGETPLDGLEYSHTLDSIDWTVSNDGPSDEDDAKYGYPVFGEKSEAETE